MKFVDDDDDEFNTKLKQYYSEADMTHEGTVTQKGYAPVIGRKVLSQCPKSTYISSSLTMI